MEILKQLSMNELFAQITGFLLLLFLLKTFAWKKFLKLLDDRREKIALEFEKVENARDEAARLKADYERKLGEIEETSKSRMRETMLRAKQLAEETREESQRQARNMLKKTEETIAIEIARAREELKNKVISLTIDTTERIIKEKLTEEKDKLLVSQFLEELDKT